MEMRKFIVEIRPDGRVYVVEYQSMLDAYKTIIEVEKEKSYRAGYYQAVEDMEDYYREH